MERKCAQCGNTTDGHKFCSCKCYHENKRKVNSLPKGFSRCSQCKKIKTLSEFGTSKKSSTRVLSWCRECYRLRHREAFKFICIDCGKSCSRIRRYSDEKEKRKQRCQRCARAKSVEDNGGIALCDRGTEHFSGRTYASWRLSAVRRHHVWELTKQLLEEIFVKQDGRCALTGIKMSARKPKSPFRPSIDRIDSSKGYELGNVQFICSIVNVMKNKYGEETFTLLCALIALHNSARFGLDSFDVAPILSRLETLFVVKETKQDS